MKKYNIEERLKHATGFFYAGDVKYPFAQIGEVFDAQLNNLPLPTPWNYDAKTEK